MSYKHFDFVSTPDQYVLFEKFSYHTALCGTVYLTATWRFRLNPETSVDSLFYPQTTTHWSTHRCNLKTIYHKKHTECINTIVFFSLHQQQYFNKRTYIVHANWLLLFNTSLFLYSHCKNLYQNFHGIQHYWQVVYLGQTVEFPVADFIM